MISVPEMLATWTLRNNVPMINNSVSVPLCNGSLIPASMKTIYFAELPARQCRSPFTRGIMIHTPRSLLENGRKIDVRSVADIDPGRGRGRGWWGIFLSGGSFPSGSMIRTSKIDDDRALFRAMISHRCVACNYAQPARIRCVYTWNRGKRARTKSQPKPRFPPPRIII